MELLTTKEFDYLYRFIKPFHHRVSYLEKIQEPMYDSQECYEAIQIEVLGDSRLLKLPVFEAGKYYKNLELNKKYFLDELGLNFTKLEDYSEDVVLEERGAEVEQ